MLSARNQLRRNANLQIISLPLEKLIDNSIGWFLPFYSSFRTLVVIAFITYHKTAGDIGYTHLLVPFLKPREPSLDWIFAWLNEVLDVLCYILVLAVEQLAHALSLVFSPIWKLHSQIRHLCRSPTDMEPKEKDGGAVSYEPDTTLLQVPHASGISKTPRRKQNKPRYSEAATPYVPGHLVADESVHPPVQPRLHPSERSADDLPAFQEAMDRAQAAFYEVGSPPVVTDQTMASRKVQTAQMDSSLLAVPRTARTLRSRGVKAAPKTPNQPTERAEKVSRLKASSDSCANNRPVAHPSTRALGKRRQVMDDTDTIATANPMVQGKIAKIGSFEDSRDGLGKDNRIRSSGTDSNKARLPKARPDANSRLPTRHATRAQKNRPEGIGISTEAQKAREAAILARKRKA